MLPEKSQGKVLQATVENVGSVSKGNGGEIQQVNLKAGDKVLLPEYGGTKVVLDSKGSFFFSLSFVVVVGCTQGMQKFPSQGWNLSHSSEPSHSTDNSGSLKF